MESGELHFRCRGIVSFVGLCQKWQHSLMICVVRYCIPETAASVIECMWLSAYGYTLSPLFAMFSCIHARYSQSTVNSSACYLGLILYVRDVTSPCYILRLFSVTPFSICELPGGVYWWVVCLSFDWFRFRLCIPHLLPQSQSLCHLPHSETVCHIVMLPVHSAASSAVSSRLHTVHMEICHTIVIEILQQI